MEEERAQVYFDGLLQLNNLKGKVRNSQRLRSNGGSYLNFLDKTCRLYEKGFQMSRSFQVTVLNFGSYC